jgi:hypothetical protein
MGFGSSLFHLYKRVKVKLWDEGWDKWFEQCSDMRDVRCHEAICTRDVTYKIYYIYRLNSCYSLTKGNERRCNTNTNESALTLDMKRAVHLIHTDHLCYDSYLTAVVELGERLFSISWSFRRNNAVKNKNTVAEHYYDIRFLERQIINSRRQWGQTKRNLLKPVPDLLVLRWSSCWWMVRDDDPYFRNRSFVVRYPRWGSVTNDVLKLSTSLSSKRRKKNSCFIWSWPRTFRGGSKRV